MLQPLVTAQVPDPQSTLSEEEALGIAGYSLVRCTCHTCNGQDERSGEHTCCPDNNDRSTSHTHDLRLDLEAQALKSLSVFQDMLALGIPSICARRIQTWRAQTPICKVPSRIACTAEGMSAPALGEGVAA